MQFLCCKAKFWNETIPQNRHANISFNNKNTEMMMRKYLPGSQKTQAEGEMLDERAEIHFKFILSVCFDGMNCAALW